MIVLSTMSGADIMRKASIVYSAAASCNVR